MILLPSDSFIGRRLVLLSGISDKNIKILISKMKSIYFIEMVHYGHPYHSSGAFKMADSIGTLAAVAFIGSSANLAEKQAKILLELFEGDVKALVIPENIPDRVEIKDELAALALDLSYQDLYHIDLQQLSTKYGVSPKTIRRRIDSLLEKNVLASYPLLNQAAIRDFNILVAMLDYNPQSTREQAMKKVESLKLTGERYLLHRFINGVLTLLVCYESPGELDQIIEELDYAFNGTTIFTRFVTEMNTHVL